MCFRKVIVGRVEIRLDKEFGRRVNDKEVILLGFEGSGVV